MTKNLDEEGFSSVINSYDLFLVDLWGVVHNGIILHKEAVNVLTKILDHKKDFVLLTNAPVPKKKVELFLESFEWYTNNLGKYNKETIHAIKKIKWNDLIYKYNINNYL